MGSSGPKRHHLLFDLEREGRHATTKGPPRIVSGEIKLGINRIAGIRSRVPWIWKEWKGNKFVPTKSAICSPLEVFAAA